MFWFKCCPRCSGDLFKDSDQYGPFVTCLQCGFSKDIASQVEGPQKLTAEPVPAPVAPPPEGSKRRRLSHGGRHFAKTFALGAGLTSNPAA